MLWWNIALFLLGLLLLIKGGDWFVDGATGIARRFRMPEILIGATIVSVGTTLPEVLVSAGAAIGGHGEIAYGNAVGSIICNAALIAAITIACRPSKVEKGPLYAPIGFFFGAAVIYLASAYLLKRFDRTAGFLLLSIFVLYMTISLLKTAEPRRRSEHSEAQAEKNETTSLIKSVLPLIVGAVMIAFGADLLVDNGTVIAQKMGVPEAVIALTFVSLGTSLPELVTAITSLAKGHGALSLGNIVGANLFNLVLVSGISIVLSPFEIPASQTIAGIPSSLVLDLPLVLVTMGILTLPTVIRGKTSRVQGIALLMIYAVFCVLQFTL